MAAHSGAVTKLLLIIGLFGAAANALSAQRDPPLLIDGSPAPLDASR